ncbi:hypothetical protein [Pseudofrankia inefficax]|uniref:Lipopolysaccharide assembly protein A domain-containing protein n=1 Tax=Pseudofrankia inefficax (strain DSM 45817 / CECT 9037 / DDB 130130 / EuI1c) TaxID=298654 RepID=E3J7D6_PSEI1|nr:hypothetical protein [Pseudofrankia inefficax]ADP78409.1 hypothetical protein FraEuI1c_0323 [Pseudofrankia inefficax]
MFTLGVVLLVIAGGLTADIVLESNDVTQVALFGHEFAFDNWRLFAFGLLTGVLTVIALQLMWGGLVRGGRRRRTLRVQRRELAAAGLATGSTVPQATTPAPQATVPQATVPRATVPSATVPQAAAPQPATAPRPRVPQAAVPQPTGPTPQATAPVRSRFGRRSTDGTLIGSGRETPAGAATVASAEGARTGPAPVVTADDSATATMPFRRFRRPVGKPADSDGAAADRGDAVPAQSTSRTGAGAVYPSDRPKDRVVARARGARDTVGQDTARD